MAPEPRPSEGHELIGQTVGGRYRVKGVLGEGGMGTVYDAEHLGLSRQVAIKVLSPAQAKKRVAVKRFQQEARAAGAIGHPNICEVYDLGLLDDGSPYLVMEKLVGQTLADRIGKEGGLPFDEVVEVIVQVLSGLVAAHEKGIIHRDIKPENIFLARRVGSPPIIKLLDFGVSKMMPEFQTGEDALDLTRTGMVMGTPYYMSPEQARGERNLDGRVDVYACGVVMYEAIAGKRPFLAPNYNALLLAIINTLPRPLRELRPKTPPELEAIIATAMARNRADRFPSAKHFLRELAPPAQAPIAEGSGRLPLPPTAEERKRAQVLGGGRPPGPIDLRGDWHDVHDAPSATLRSRMTEGTRESRLVDPSRDARLFIDPRVDPRSGVERDPRQSLDRATSIDRDPRHGFDRPTSVDRDPEPRDSRRGLDRATSIEGRPQRAPQVLPQVADPPGPPAARRRSDANLPPYHRNDSADVDIPIHVAIEEDEPEDPTEIFQPRAHMFPPRAPSRPSGGGRPTSGPHSGQPPAPHPHLPLAPKHPDVSIDEWDSETVVKRPDLVPPSLPEQHPARAPRKRDPRPFNPDETINLDATRAGDIELIDERHLPPRRRG